MAEAINKDSKLELLYTMFCDDVRLEVGNKLSFMGVFQNIMVQQLPVSLIKFAVVNHWRGEGTHLSEVRILTPDRQHPVVVSQPTSFEITPGQYWVQTLVDSNLFDEQELTVSDGRELSTENASQAVN